MPIDPKDYPSDWPAISRRIRFDRAGGRCECDGFCGDPGCGPDRCPAEHGQPNPRTGSIVVLTTAHMNHTPMDVRDENLRALCQKCHLRYDGKHHAATRRARIAAEAGPGLFDM